MARNVCGVLVVLALCGCRAGRDASPPADPMRAPPAAALPPADPGNVDSSTISITGPTLVAVVPYGRAYLDAHVIDASADTSGLATALDDFSFYFSAADSALKARGIRVLLRLDSVIRWAQSGRRDSLSLDPDSGVAYLFWSPRGLRVRRGVTTDIDILSFVDSALGVQRP